MINVTKDMIHPEVVAAYALFIKGMIQSDSQFAALCQRYGYDGVMVEEVLKAVEEAWETGPSNIKATLSETEYELIGPYVSDGSWRIRFTRHGKTTLTSRVECVVRKDFTGTVVRTESGGLYSMRGVRHVYKGQDFLDAIGREEKPTPTATLLMLDKREEHKGLGPRAVVKLSEPAKYWCWTEDGGEDRSTDHLSISQSERYGEPETYAFPCDKDGVVTSWGEMHMSQRGTYCWRTVLVDAGYEIIED